MPTATLAPVRARPLRRPRFVDSTSRVIVVVEIDGVPRVRGSRVARTKGVQGYLEVTETFLDGNQRFTAHHRDTVSEEWSMVDPIGTVSTSDRVDFGRLQQAAAQLIVAAQALDARGVEASRAELESLLATRANLHRWRDTARASLAAAEGKIEDCDEVIRRVFDR